jgi:hypothetical protein
LFFPRFLAVAYPPFNCSIPVLSGVYLKQFPLFCGTEMSFLQHVPFQIFRRIIPQGFQTFSATALPEKWQQKNYLSGGSQVV